jgi:hypothetical protein
MNVRTISGVLLAAVILSGCSVQLRTATAAVDACDEALLTGRLVGSAASGLAIADADGKITEMLWPFGYSARRDVSGIALIDDKGRLVAREGEMVHMAGGLGANDVWGACPGTVARLEAIR